MTIRKPATAVVVCLMALPLSGCALGRKDAAESIDAAVAQLPGVASSAYDYDAGWPKGEERFGLTAVLRDTATPEQAGELGKTFVGMVKAKDFPGVDVALEVKYRVVDRMNQVPATSAAKFSVDQGSAAGVPDALREWLTIAQSPGVQSVRLNRPDQTVGVTVDQNAKDADLQALAKSHPELDHAEWAVTGGSLAETSPYAADYPEVYRVRGMIPDAALRDLWSRIVAEVGAAGQVGAETDTNRKDTPTTVDVNFPTSRDREQNLAQAWMVLPLLQKLPQPAKVNFDGAVFTIGGCTPPDQSRNMQPMEVELRLKYEKC